MSGKGQKYICANCFEENEKGRSDEEALSETKELFGDIPKEQLVIICDDCFQIMEKRRLRSTH